MPSVKSAVTNVMTPELTRRVLIEFIGTFFLVFTIAIAGNPVATGAILIALVYMGFYVSGAHFNPAVTLAALIRRNCISVQTAVAYWIAQFLGGAAAAGVFYWMAKDFFVPVTGTGIAFETAFVCELLFTFLLAMVVLHTTTSEETKGNTFYGAAIGLTVMAAGFSIGQISGGVLNPAVVLGPVLATGSNMDQHTTILQLFILGPLLGGLAAGLVYRIINPMMSMTTKAKK